MNSAIKGSSLTGYLKSIRMTERFYQTEKELLYLLFGGNIGLRYKSVSYDYDGFVIACVQSLSAKRGLYEFHSSKASSKITKINL